MVWGQPAASDQIQTRTFLSSRDQSRQLTNLGLNTGKALPKLIGHNAGAGWPANSDADEGAIASAAFRECCWYWRQKAAHSARQPGVTSD